MKIEIDARESDDTKNVMDLFLSPTVRMLEVGDILVDNKVVFEHKSQSDFIASVFDGRLFRQIVEMQENYPHSYVLVSASMTDVLNAAEDMNRYASILAAICSCFARGCPVIFCDTLVNMTDIIKTLSEKLTDGKARNRPVTKMKLEDKRIQLLCALPGVSEQKGRDILKEFGSVDASLNASSDDLQKVYKVGKVTADGIREVLES